MKRILIFLSIFFLPLVSTAQPVASTTSADILLSLKKLNTIGSVLYVAAHPDDENTRLLAYLAKEKNLRTAYISITRGDGGQNLVGKEQGDLLGLMRTQELLAARRMDGAEQFFTRANDFGYSKNPEETLLIWNKDSILKDMVWAIRKFKPDVIICRFPTTGEGGHGHHTASAILALEAFDVAADAKRFPEHLAYTEVWQAKRILWNTFNFGTTNTTSPDQLKLDVGVFNPLLGKSYNEIAAESRSNHKSQGFGSAKGRGSAIEYFKMMKGDSVQNDLFEGIDLTWKRFAATVKIKGMVDECISNFDALAPEKSINALTAIYKQLQLSTVNDAAINYWKQLKLKETEALLIACSGLWMEASAVDYIGIPGDTVSITAQVINRNKSEVKLRSINFLNQNDTLVNVTLNHNELMTFKRKELLPASLVFSNPYWLNETHEAGIFKIKDPLLTGTPENASQVNVVFNIDINGIPLSIQRPVLYKSTDPVKGEVYRPYEALPPATVNISEKVFVFHDASPKEIQFTVKANANNVSGTLEISLPDSWNLSIKNSEFKLTNKGDEAIINATISKGSSNGSAKLSASLRINNKVYNKSIQRIEYDHIPYQFILTDAEAKLIQVDLKKTDLNIGYIIGAGDDIPSCLKQVGYNVTLLDDEALTHHDLSQFKTIITGIRAYNTNDRLQLHYSKLMEYVKGGGNLIVQYNTNSRIGPVKAKIGPYPFTISRDRVTDEKAEVRVIDATHKALTFPNKITSKDFDGWIQERGIYFATEIDSNYSTIFSMNDPSDKPSDGSLIIAKHGKGHFVYTGLAFFRELPAGVPGAYRLFVNLISLPTYP